MTLNFAQVRSKYGSRLTCLLPGILVPEEWRLPYCTRAKARNESDELGYKDLHPPSTTTLWNPSMVKLLIINSLY